MRIGYLTGLIVIDCDHDWHTPSQVITDINSEFVTNNFQSLIPNDVEVRVVPSLEPTGANFEGVAPQDIYSRAYINIYSVIQDISWTDLQIMVKNILMRLSGCDGFYIEDIVFKMKYEENSTCYDKVVTEATFKIDYED